MGADDHKSHQKYLIGPDVHIFLVSLTPSALDTDKKDLEYILLILLLCSRMKLAIAAISLTHVSTLHFSLFQEKIN